VPITSSGGADDAVLSNTELVARVALLQQVEFFAELPTHVVAAVAKVATRRRFEANEVVVAEGDHGDEMFVIDSGRVAISSQGKSIAELVRLDVLGELSVLVSAPRNATARCVDAVELLRISGDVIEELLLDYPEISWGIIVSLVHRIRSSSTLYE
jgi:CRP/FNR family transcriptional regulator, cyclic AMP receptor protein